MNWYTSDLHLGHKAIIEMNNRPFKDVNEMNETIIANFNARVQKQDHVYILGDCTHHLTIGEAHNLLSRLHGRKHLIIGNHDKLVTSGDIFETVDMYLEITDYSHNFVLCHYPFSSWKKQRSGWIHLHGHSHNNEAYNVYNKENKIFKLDVGVEAHNYFPWSTKEILNFLGIQTK